MRNQMPSQSRFALPRFSLPAALTGALMAGAGCREEQRAPTLPEAATVATPAVDAPSEPPPVVEVTLPSKEEAPLKQLPQDPQSLVPAQRSLPPLPKFRADCHSVANDPQFHNIDVVALTLDGALQRNEMRLVDAIAAVQGDVYKMMVCYEELHEQLRQRVQAMSTHILDDVQASERKLGRALTGRELVGCINGRFFDRQFGFRLLGEPLISSGDLLATWIQGASQGQESYFGPSNAALAVMRRAADANLRAHARVAHEHRHEITQPTPERLREEEAALLYEPKRAKGEYQESPSFGVVWESRQGTEEDLLSSYMCVIDFLASAGVQVPLMPVAEHGRAFLYHTQDGDSFAVDLLNHGELVELDAQLASVGIERANLAPYAPATSMRLALAIELFRTARDEEHAFSINEYQAGEMFIGANRLGLSTPESLRAMAESLACRDCAKQLEASATTFAQAFSLLDRADQKQAPDRPALMSRFAVLKAHANRLLDFHESERALDAALRAGKVLSQAQALPGSPKGVSDFDIAATRGDFFAAFFQRHASKEAFHEALLSYYDAQKLQPKNFHVIEAMGDLYWQRHKLLSAALGMPEQSDLKAAQTLLELATGLARKHEEQGKGYAPWGYADSVLARIYDELGDEQNALLACERALSCRLSKDLGWEVLSLGKKVIEKMTAEGRMGAEEAAQRTQAMSERYERIPSPRRHWGHWA